MSSRMVDIHILKFRVRVLSLLDILDFYSSVGIVFIIRIGARRQGAD